MKFDFCFIDEIRNERVKTSLNIKILQEKASPIYIKTDSSGCFNYITKANMVKFVVQSPFFKTDTIIRYIDTNEMNMIKLNSDDYALALHYYVNGNIKDFKKREKQLNNLISDDAKIYQIFDEKLESNYMIRTTLSTN